MANATARPGMNGQLSAKELVEICEQYEKTREDFEFVLLLEEAIQSGVQGVRKEREANQPGAKKT